MFEGSLVESGGLVATGTQKWTAAGSLTLQCLLAAVIVAIPLLRPEVLKIPAASVPLAAPLLRRPQVVVVVRHVDASAATAMSLPAAGLSPIASRPSVWPHPEPVAEDGPPTVQIGRGMGPASGTGEVALGIGNGPAATVVRERPVGPVNISKGVTEGMLLAPIRPVYPAIARTAGVQGTVIMEAVISKEGRIESLHALSGPMMLQRAALEAVAGARYRPYLLNGEPTEVKTTVTVVFSLGRSQL